MPLILQPSFSSKTREQIEAHLLVVRARRMAAVATYYAGVNAKNMHLIAKEQERVGREYERLRRDVEKMAKLEEAIEQRLIVIEQHQQQLDIHRSNLVEIGDGDAGKANGKDSSARGSFRAGRPPGS